MTFIRPTFYKFAIKDFGRRQSVWMTENISGAWHIRTEDNMLKVVFWNEEDAMAYKLYWTEDIFEYTEER